MGRSARMLIMLVVALVAAFSVAAASASATFVKVRVETNTSNSVHGLVDRTPVTIAANAPDLQIPDDSVAVPPDPQPTHACPAASPLGAVLSVPNVPASAKYLTATHAFTLAKVKSLPGTFLTKQPTWEIWVGGRKETGDLCRPLTADDDFREVLAVLRCEPSLTAPRANEFCFPAGYNPLKLRIDIVGDWAPIETYVTQGAVKVQVVVAESGGAQHPSSTASVGTDENIKPVLVDQRFQDGTASIPFTAPGDHVVYATDNFAIPDRIPVCSSNGADGFCGNPFKPPPDFDPTPGPCDTNGADGRCGTIDTTGPPVEVNNIKQGQVFRTKKGPTGVNGITNFGLDPNGLRDVRVRLTRTVVQKVKIKPKKKKKGKASKKKAKVRYRKTKVCTYWNDGTLLFQRAKRCGAAGGQWFQTDLSDLRDTFKYDFALRLPKGTYLLEVQSADENGSLDPPTPGRNILKFVVK
jgi:hypothetical protein